MPDWMKGYVRDLTVSEDEMVTLKDALVRRGYTLRDVPQNEWQLFAVDRGFATGGVYTNRRGEISMPEEVFDVLKKEVWSTTRPSLL